MASHLETAQLLAIVRNLVDIADSVSMKYARESQLTIETKSDDTPVTEADKEVELALRHQLSRDREGDIVVGEEFNPIAPSFGTYWVIDPIDGTKNFIRKVPVWATLIGYVADGKPRFGMVSAPMLARRWWGGVESGSFTSDVDGSVRPIHVSGISHLQNASLSYSDDADWQRIGKVKQLHELKKKTWRQRAYGDFWSHMMVAEGSVDIAAEPKLALWDVAALIPIVEGAGGMITGINGESPLESLSAFTSNAALHPQLLEVFQTP